MLAKSLFVMGGSICASNKSLFALKPTESKCFSLIFHKFILVSVVRNLVGLFVLLLIPLKSCRCSDGKFFFSDEIAVVGGENGVHFTFSREGRPSGECFIELVDEANVQKSLQKNNEHMGNRYIEGNLYISYS